MTVTLTFQSFAKRLGLEGAKVHHLLRFHASVLLQNGQGLLLVSKRLRHASTSTKGKRVRTSVTLLTKGSSKRLRQSYGRGLAETDVGKTAAIGGPERFG